MFKFAAVLASRWKLILTVIQYVNEITTFLINIIHSLKVTITCVSSDTSSFTTCTVFVFMLYYGLFSHDLHIIDLWWRSTELTMRFGWESVRLILRDLGHCPRWRSRRGQWARSQGINPDSHTKLVDNSGSATTILATKYLYNDAKCLFLS